MLQLVMGRAGTGKTTMILDQAIESARMGQYVMLIVPEQFSFETEKAIYTTLHGSDAMRMDVLSFSRLAENIFRTYGGLARKRLNDMSRLVLMKLALKETADNLQVYQRQSDKTTFVTTMLETVEELKSSGTAPWQLQEVANQAQSAHLKAKLKDISLIYEAYQAIIDRDYEDPLDDIAKASRLTCEKNFFAGKTIYIDGFDFFSPPERELIQNMMIQAWQITVALSADGLEYRGETDIFLSQKRTAHQLITFARANGISVKSPVMLTEIIRTSSQALHSVEALLRGENPDPALDAQGIKLVLCSQKYEEARFAAAQIHALVREKGMRYRDFAIVCRNMDDYELPVSEAFADYKIPIFYDKKESAMTQPIAVTAMAALDAVRGTYKTEAILKLARSPALGLNAHQVAKLENYCYVWTVEGKSWLEPFRNDPAGISGAAPESYREELSEVETIRKTLMKPLSTLKKSLTGCDGRGFVLGLYEYLETVHALDNLRNYFTSEYPDDDTFIQHNDALWGMMVDIMDLFCDTLGQVRYPVSVFTELFGLALSCAELGSIPNTLDQAIVGSADRVRLRSPKILFAIGLNEGVFPAQYQSHGVFTDAERADLIRQGVEISSPCYEWTLLERFYLYRTMCAPREQLYVSCAVSDVKGEPREPSAAMQQLLECFPQAVMKVEELEPEFFVANLETVMSQYAREYRAGNVMAATLRELLVRQGLSSFAEAINRSGKDAPADNIAPETADLLLRGKISVSPTKIENFYKCPYLFYCDNLLRLRPRRRVAYTPLESGSAIHYVLEILLKEVGGHGISRMDDNTLMLKTQELLQQYIKLMVPDTSQLASRFQYQFQRLVKVLCTILRHIGTEFEQSLFVAAGMEVPVGPGQTIEPRPVLADNGTPIEMVGKIDRVDVYEEGEERFARVIDYKSGGKDFKLEDVMYGLNMQMLVYLFCLCDDTHSPFGKVRPAGILYMPGKVTIADAAPDADQGEVQSLIEDTLKMKGVLLDDERVLRAMERELEGKYIPAKLNKKSPSLSSSSRVKSQAEFEAIRKLVYQNILEMANRLTGGKVAPMPVRGAAQNPCEYCDYGLLCNNCNGNCFKDITKQPDDGKKGGEQDG